VVYLLLVGVEVVVPMVLMAVTLEGQSGQLSWKIERVTRAWCLLLRLKILAAA
jgi:hypothetical protein